MERTKLEGCIARPELYFDGSITKNPGGEGWYGWLIKRGDEVVSSGHGIASERGPHSTVNTAEYTALIKGLEALRGMGATIATVLGDSQLVIRQMDYEWRVKARHLRPLFKRAQRAKLGIEITWCWIPRGQNKEADALSKMR